MLAGEENAMTKHRCAIVTGAGSGIGRAAAVQLASEGWDVVLVGRTRAKLEETASLVEPDGGEPGEMEIVVADLLDAEATRGVVAQTLESFGRIDAIANVAGAAPTMPIEKFTPEAWRECIDANLTYVMAITAAAWPAFRKQKSGVVVNVSSVASIDPFPGFALYAPAKAALNMFTLCTAREGKEIGVSTVAVAPGAVETPMLRGLFSEKMIPRDKTLRPEAVAEVICGCITGGRKFEPGETIVVPSP